MLDPFPIPVITPLANWFRPLSEKYVFYALPLHIHEILFFFFLYTGIQLFISPALSRRCFAQTYNNLSPKTRINWDIHVVSFLQSVFVCVAALYVMFFDEERNRMGGGSGVNGVIKTEFGTDADKGIIGEYGYWERVFAYTGATGFAQAAGCGYFLWDLMVSLRYTSMFGPGMLAHAVAAVTVFSFGFRPFLLYYAPTFVLYELSSPFLNIHWFCDKLKLTGSKIQLVNGILLLATFFGCRLVYGSWQSFMVFYDLWRAYKYGPPATSLLRATAANPFNGVHATTIVETDPIAEIYNFNDASTKVPVWMALTYLVSNSLLNALNWYWMGQMITTIRKRFPPPFGTLKVPAVKSTDAMEETKAAQKTTSAVGNGGLSTGVARGVYADGHKSVEVEGLEVRQRPDVKRGVSEQVFVP